MFTKNLFIVFGVRVWRYWW